MSSFSIQEKEIMAKKIADEIMTGMGDKTYSDLQKMGEKYGCSG